MLKGGGMAEESIVTYLAREQRSFDVEPFNMIDGLVLATLSYLRFESVEGLRVTSPDEIFLRDLIAGPEAVHLLRDGWMRKSPHSTRFLQELSRSARYANMRICLFVDEHVDNAEKQFAAVTFLLDDGRAYVTFRGTDGTMVGWKENFNVVFREFTPAQLAAVSYTSGVASAFPGNLVLIGHSKGGSNAQYAALCVPDQVFERIDMAMNFDGPSFLSDPSPRVEEPRFKKIFHKIVPEGSLFGLLLEEGDNYRVIKSYEKVSRQHEPFSWALKGNDFLYVNDLRKRAKWADGTLNAWMKSRTVEERRVFIDLMYELLSSTEAQTIFELREKMGSTMRSILSASKQLDPERRKLVVETMRKLASVLRVETRKALEDRHDVKKAQRAERRAEHRAELQAERIAELQALQQADAQKASWTEMLIMQDAKSSSNGA